MLATIALKNLLLGKEFSEISEVYVNNLPKEIQENTDKTVMLLREADTSIDLFGNDTFFGKNYQIEVQIFYKLNINFDLEDFETKLMKFLVSEHYNITDIREHSIDPDTLQMTAVFYVAYKKII
ncbi:hypothetical protein HMPREF9318_00095 [Streptococcus urinalis FB127-CNA-2]|uniref:Uncharacterized protein n=1 Tax=Streptococcus urinalis 2285-97 TaxID=764291 RepID=G5KEJ9_9STRE|nr:DUF806 family protein [Streptococcus urinalis]QBX22157.1 hypothetical protein Javan637_0049 [Streptococcus phage Javan637]QBX31613.1 hypothetical protein Javan642_0049 [Streptococcus phage Javan642]QBX31642.1 hypothetical protein Javan648_0016 [Streptococcus phage Javan648]EHJ57183.1 hypothetical protein STRUR_0834 [Streptococcus urinalis 2285-97]EKS21897.1 hypothetical protein HMPREF9318_00095 [Streptococcus urinalis FB127-CNA-2]